MTNVSADASRKLAVCESRVIGLNATIGQLQSQLATVTQSPPASDTTANNSGGGAGANNAPTMATKASIIENNATTTTRFVRDARSIE